jgi:hypothetical protein
MNAVAAASVDVTGSVGVDAIWDPAVAVGKQLAVLQTLAVFGDVEAVDGGGSCGVSVEGRLARVGDVLSLRRTLDIARGSVNDEKKTYDVLEVRRELNAVRGYEVIRHSLNHTGVGFESVDLRTNARCGPEPLPVTVGWVGEPEVAGIPVLLHVVG